MNFQKKDFQDESYIINEEDSNNDHEKIKVLSLSNDFKLKDYYVAKQKIEITCGKINLKKINN
jgi:hypothetical protein